MFLEHHLYLHFIFDVSFPTITYIGITIFQWTKTPFPSDEKLIHRNAYTASTN
ncbi:MAG: hypothetical protein CM15mP83_5940 [Flavobacteriaceae bacterium]|nr:MAG: hypothetical protein CM15mP83_5940 [Flavobacteriaceae bacterium]